ncbi:NADP-dependent oxidoreductase domain-containing protein [Lipomyces arxii]|uniref:NADP-dependent oxidoreductase domain-containing protein n=1 Tax=Lipomyces arxii TaxID=56418 RepID=UPI0034CD7C08
MVSKTAKIGEAIIPAIGLGCMGMSAFYKTKMTNEAAMTLLSQAADMGCTFWDTSDAYMDNELVLGEWFRTTGRRSEIFLASKFGITTTPQGRVIRGQPDYVKLACDRSLKRLGVDYIDLYYQHRVDQTTPIEVTVGAMAELVKEGKVKYLGLSECSESTLRRAHKVHPIAAVQIEYSPFALQAEDNGLIATCKELGVAVVSYSPLGRGFLTGVYKSILDFPEGDFRRSQPRFQGENFDNNVKLVNTLTTIATIKGVTTGQLALAWIVSQGAIPIPGTTKNDRLVENFAARGVEITEEEAIDIREAVKAANIVGDRYDVGVQLLYADSPELPK